MVSMYKYSLFGVFSPIIRLTMRQGTGKKWNKHCVELDRNGFFHWDEMGRNGTGTNIFQNHNTSFGRIKWVIASHGHTHILVPM